MKLFLPISAMVCTALATVTALVFCMSMGANSTGAQYRALKLWMGGITLFGVASIVAGMLLIRAGQPGWAAGVSFTPAATMIVVLGIALLRMISK